MKQSQFTVTSKSPLISTFRQKRHTHLGEFYEREHLRTTPWKLAPLTLGDEGYLWGRSNVVFRKGKFTFWLSSVIGNSYGHDQFDMKKEATESFAKDVVKALHAN